MLMEWHIVWTLIILLLEEQFDLCLRSPDLSISLYKIITVRTFIQV